MKCKFCGSNLGIEDELCPHCGKPNDQYEGNRTEMKEYREEYEKTKEDVKESSKTNSRLGRIIVIGILLSVILAMAIATSGYSNFEIREKNKNKKIDDYVTDHKDEIDATLAEYENNRDYISIDYFALNYRLRSNEAYYRDYGRLFTASIHYRAIHDDIFNILDGYEGYENETNRDWCDNIALYITEWDRYIPPVDANPYLPVTDTGHEAYVNDCKKAVQDMVQVYFDLTTDQANDMWQMEKGEVCDMLYSKCMDLYPEE